MRINLMIGCTLVVAALDGVQGIISQVVPNNEVVVKGILGLRIILTFGSNHGHKLGEDLPVRLYLSGVLVSESWHCGGERLLTSFPLIGGLSVIAILEWIGVSPGTISFV